MHSVSHPGLPRFGANIAYDPDVLRAKLGRREADKAVRLSKKLKTQLDKWADDKMYIKIAPTSSWVKGLDGYSNWFNEVSATLYVKKENGEWSLPETMHQRRRSLMRFEPMGLFFHRVVSQAKKLAVMYDVEPKPAPVKKQGGWVDDAASDNGRATS